MSKVTEAIKIRMPGGYFLRRMDYLRRNWDTKNDLIMKAYLEYCKLVYRYGGKHIRHSLIFNEKYKVQGGGINFEGLLVPLLDEGAIGTFWLEFPDLVLPYILEKRNRQYDFASVDVLITEGPYELKKEVSVAGGDVVVDCGANLGLFSAVAGRKAKKVYAFEPDPQIIENYLSQTIRLNKTDATICPYALGRKAGTCSFERAPKDNLGSGKVTGVEKENTFPVEIVTLDQFVEDNGIEKIDFIKADIEGAERDMLRGATRVLKEMAPKLSICTYHLPDDKEVLEGIVLKANPQYKIEHHYQKLYAYVPKN